MASLYRLSAYKPPVSMATIATYKVPKVDNEPNVRLGTIPRHITFAV